MQWKLNSNLTAMSIVGACLILVGGTVVAIYHCYRMLGWIALFPAAGFLFADYLGFHLIFFSRKETGLLGWGALICKFLIFGTLLINGASLVYLLVTDAKDRAATASAIERKKAEAEIETESKIKLIEADSNARKSEETQRAENAAKIAQATGSIKLAREVTTTKKDSPIVFDAVPSTFPLNGSPSETKPQAVEAGTVERFARWYTRAPLYFSGGLVALCCFVLIQIFGKLDADRAITPGSKPANNEFPSHIDADLRRPENQPRFSGTREASQDRNNASLETGEASQDALKALQEACSLIAFQYPGKWFAVEKREDHVRVRMRTRVDGREQTLHSTKVALSILYDVLTMKPDAFRSRLEDFLRKRGFLI